MHKLLTFSEPQYEKIREVMKTTRHESFSEFVRYLVLFYEENQKRPPGRPKQTDREEDEPSSDDTPKYKVPDKFTTSAYSYNDMVAWYDAHPEAGPMPARDDLVIHKSYKGY